MTQIPLYDPRHEAAGGVRRVFMVGHSNHPIGRFMDLLTRHGVVLLVDVRSRAQSRFCPWFNAKALEAALREHGIGYRHCPGLGGKPPLPLAELRAQAASLMPLLPGTCLMCSEGDYLECHRHYLLTPLLLELGVSVDQIASSGAIASDLGPSPATLRKMRAYMPPA